MRVMAFDYGRKRIGVAVSDEGASLARPLALIPAVPRMKAMKAIGRLVAEYGPGEIVVGNPKGGAGRAGLGREVEVFASRLREMFALRVVFHDETLTTVTAAERLKEAGVGPAERKGKIDQAAAAVILQDYLESAGVRPG